MSVSFNGQDPQLSPPRLRARQGLGKPSTMRQTLGRKEALALTSCAKLNDAGIVGKNQKDHIEGCKAIIEEGVRVGSLVEAADSCSVDFHGKNKVMDLFLKSKESYSFPLKEGFEAHARRLIRIIV